MGCFCRLTFSGPQPEPDSSQAAADEGALADPPPVVEALTHWLARRWLPAPPWEPDPEWLETEWPDPAMPPTAMAVLTSLFVAQRACRDALDLDPAQPADLKALTRIVATLNRRTEQMQDAERDQPPWERVALLNGQADTTRDAAVQRIFHPRPRQEDEVPFGPWRETVVKLKALSPLVAIGQMLQLDFAEPSALDRLAAAVRPLRQVELPPLDDPGTVLRTLARNDAIGRLWTSFGRDPRPVPFERVARAVQDKLRRAVEALPDEVQYREGVLAGLPETPPNPSQLVNAATVAAARKLTQQMLDRVNWDVPRYEDLPLLASGSPVAALVGSLRRLGASPVQDAPCNRDCDAASAMRDAYARSPAPDAAQPGSQEGSPSQPQADAAGEATGPYARNGARGLAASAAINTHNVPLTAP